MTLNKYISSVEERLKAATPGPWVKTIVPMEHNGYVDGEKKVRTYYFPTGPATIVDEFKNGGFHTQAKADAAFIAHAPTDIANLLAIVKVQRDALEFYAGEARDSGWDKNRFIALDKFGGFDADAAGPAVALNAIVEAEKIANSC